MNADSRDKLLVEHQRLTTCLCVFSTFRVGNKAKERQRPAECAGLGAARAEEDCENDQGEHGRPHQPAQKHLVEPVDTKGGVGRRTCTLSASSV